MVFHTMSLTLNWQCFCVSPNNNDKSSIFGGKCARHCEDQNWENSYANSPRNSESGKRDPN